MLVSTVTPITSGRGRPDASAALRAASAAAFIMALPPEAWTLTIHAPVATADLHGACHGVGNVVEFEVEKHPIAAAGELANHRRPGGGEQLLADLEAADRAAKRIGQRDRRSGRVDIQGHENRVHV